MWNLSLLTSYFSKNQTMDGWMDGCAVYNFLSDFFFHLCLFFMLVQRRSIWVWVFFTLLVCQDSKQMQPSHFRWYISMPWTADYSHVWAQVTKPICSQHHISTYAAVNHCFFLPILFDHKDIFFTFLDWNATISWRIGHDATVQHLTNYADIQNQLQLWLFEWNSL